MPANSDNRPDPALPSGQPRRRRKLSAIMMADVTGFSRMMGANEESTVDLIQEFQRRLKLLIEELEGRIVDTAGDSVFAEFDSVVNCVRCAQRIQREQGALNEQRRAEERLVTRIGIHLGDVIAEDYRLYGDGVNIAARLEPLADPGGLCISEAVYQQVRNKIDLSVEDLGLRELKNIELPIRIYKVPAAPTTSKESRRQAPAAAVGKDAAAPASAAPRAGVGSSDLGAGLGGLARPETLIPLCVAIFLLLSPLYLFPTGGIFSTLGAVLLSVVLGRVWAQRAGRSRNLLIALGVGIASGALWTNWSSVTNALFVLAGLIVSAVGASEAARPRREGRRRKTGGG